MRYVLVVPILALLVLFLSYAGSGRRAPVPAELVEVELQDMGIDPTTRSPVLILTDRIEGKVLPIFIGINEASAISRGLSHEETHRPFTHDLIVNMMGELGASLDRVVITDLKDNIFYADLVLRVRGSEMKIDCRPSDAIAIAVRLGAPIYVTKDVLEASLNEELTRWWHSEGTASRIGLSVQELTDELAKALGIEGVEGILVSGVKEGGVADRAGMKRGDIVLSIDRAAVDDPAEMMMALVEREGQVVDILITRRGEEQHIRLSVPAFEAEGGHGP